MANTTYYLKEKVKDVDTLDCIALYCKCDPMKEGVIEKKLVLKVLEHRIRLFNLKQIILSQQNSARFQIQSLYWSLCISFIFRAVQNDNKNKKISRVVYWPTKSFRFNLGKKFALKVTYNWLAAGLYYT